MKNYTVEFLDVFGEVIHVELVENTLGFKNALSSAMDRYIARGYLLLQADANLALDFTEVRIRKVD